MNTKSFRMTLIAASLAAGLGFSAVVSADSGATTEPKAHSDSVGAIITDSAITTKVKSKFIGDERLKNSDISITTTNGMVTLNGTAASTDAKATAETLAKSVDGVKGVDNDLKAPSVASTVSSDAHEAAENTERVASDSWITTKVKSEIAADSLSKGFKVSVKTKHGIVRLSGDLTSQDAIDHVKDIASKVKGVKSVNTSALKIVAA